MKKVFIDIGSYKGEELKLALELGYEVHCFEPNPAMKYFLSPYEGRAIINYAAAWHEDGIAKLYSMIKGDVSEMSLSLIHEKTNINKDSYIEVPTINIGRYLKELDKDIDLIKIDAEGAGYHIINSIIDQFDVTRIREWKVEDHSGLIYTWKDHRDWVLEKVKTNGIILNPWKGHLTDD